MVADSSVMASAVANAVGNVLRKKGKRPQKLWKRKPKPGDRDQRHSDIAAVQTVQKREGVGWIEQIYRANGRKLRRREKSTNGDKTDIS